MRNLCFILLAGLALAALIAVPMANPQSIRADIEAVHLLGVAYQGPDPYYDRNVNAYEPDSTVELRVVVHNDEGGAIDVKSVRIETGWGTDYTAGTVEDISAGATRVYEISFDIPSDISPHSAYDWKVVVDCRVNDEPELFDDFTGAPLAVLTKDRIEALNYRQQWTRLGVPQQLSARCRDLYQQSLAKEGLADAQYARGDFDNAKTSYKEALGLLQQAFAADINSLDLTPSLPRILGGVGVLIFGIGVLIYAFRRLRS
jgi:hypothetical protein